MYWEMTLKKMVFNILPGGKHHILNTYITRETLLFSLHKKAA